MPDAPLSIQVQEHADRGASVVQLNGPIVIAGMFDLQNTLRGISSKRVVIDLTNVPYMDSSGMGAILNAFVHAQKEGRELVVCGVNDRVGALFQLTRVDTLLKRYSDADAAVAG